MDLRLAMDWHQIGIGLEADWDGLAMDWHQIGIRLAWNWLIGQGLVFYWHFGNMFDGGLGNRWQIGQGLTQDWNRIGMDWSVFDIGLLLDWHQIWMDWHCIGIRLTFDWNELPPDWCWIGILLTSDWLWITVGFTLDWRIVEICERVRQSSHAETSRIRCSTSSLSYLRNVRMS